MSFSSDNHRRMKTMSQKTPASSWQANLFFIAVTAIVTTGLITLYKQYQDSKKQDAETQTDPVQTNQGNPAISTPLSHNNEKPPVTIATQPNADARPDVVATAAQLGPEVTATTGTLCTKSSQPTSPRGKLPEAGPAGLLSSRNSSFVYPTSRVASVDDNFDSPGTRTPNNSETEITPEGQEKRGARMFAAVVKTTAPASSGWLPWPFSSK